MQAEARGDLVSISQHAIESFCASFGVPSGLCFESKFVGQSSNQLRLLNSTVEQLAKSVERVLSASYRAIYGSDDAETLRLSVSPLAAVPELVMLTSAGIADAQAVQRLALRSVGVGLEDVNAADNRMRQREAETHVLAQEAAQVAAAQVAARAAEQREKAKERVANGGRSSDAVNKES